MLTNGCSEKTQPNVLLITVDALRADHLGIYGYARSTSPHIDAFFRTGTVYENAHSNETNTSPSVVSFLTGMLPQENGIRLMLQKVPAELPLVSDRLADAFAYQTAAIVSNPVLTAEAMDLDLHFDYYDDYVDEKESARDLWERTAEPTTEAAITWYASEYKPGSPYFLWLHFQDPHGPYQAPADKPVQFSHTESRDIDTTRVPPYEREAGVTDGLAYVDRYDEEIAHMDAQLGRLLSFFDSEGLLDNTVVIFSADHGESMMEHEEWFTHGYHVYEEITRVPLLFRYPNRERPRRVASRVSLVDLAPTILDRVGLDPPLEMRGQILDETLEPRPLYAQGGDWRSMTDDSKKWLVEVKHERLSKFRTRVVTRRGVVYDLAEDPQELNPLEWIATDESEEFFRFIQSDPDPGGIPAEYVGGMLPEAPKVRPTVDKETLKKLRSLGYVN